MNSKNKPASTIAGKRYTMPVYGYAYMLCAESPTGEPILLKATENGELIQGNNGEGSLLPPAARITGAHSADITNPGARGVAVYINVSAITDTPSITVKIQAKDPVSGAYVDLLASDAITGTGTTVLKVHPDLTASPNLIAADFVTRTWRVSVTNADGDSITYSIGYAYLP